MAKKKDKDSFRSVFTARIRGKSAKEKQEATESRATFQYVGGELTIDIVSNVIVKHKLECSDCIAQRDCVDLATLRRVSNRMEHLGEKQQPVVNSPQGPVPLRAVLASGVNHPQPGSTAPDYF